MGECQNGGGVVWEQLPLDDVPGPSNPTIPEQMKHMTCDG
jgi:hypothetical protein